MRGHSGLIILVLSSCMLLKIEMVSLYDFCDILGEAPMWLPNLQKNLYGSSWVRHLTQPQMNGISLGKQIWLRPSLIFQFARGMEHGRIRA
ncbi:hypothetical protein M758_11G027500 [Ceratodon purpureus]|nr:hypothetical protein M758_11G027500 [Ceratodon purpureus]